MILEHRLAPGLSKKSLLAVTLLALLVVPSVIPGTQSAPLAADTEGVAQSPTGNAESLDTSFLTKRFKYRVKFEIGRTQSKDGGRIEIREVWGTRPKIELGGQYLVRGKYALPAGYLGKLYFYATVPGHVVARRGDDGRLARPQVVSDDPWGDTASLDLQSTELDAQEGDFALIHGMAGRGYFHLSLTDANRYSNWFADVYFGSGDNVLR
jgi:hypothetical protein